jgi:adenylate cyclase, class 2
MLEIEQKFRVGALSKIAAQIGDQFEVTSDTVQEQVDWYYSHPMRDFGVSDEALRVRRTIVEGKEQHLRSVLTYKGPRIDPLGESQLFKTRREIELPIGNTPDDADRLGEILKALGFLPTATVAKVRRCLQVHWGEWKVEFALDDVRDLGTFVEIEIVANDESASTAQTAIAAIAKQLGLLSPITNSYRNMLLGDRIT